MKSTIHLLLLIIFLQPVARAQHSKADTICQINQDVWIPFLKGVNTNDPGLYNSVHANEFLWVIGGEKTRIMNLKEYVEDAAKVMDSRSQKGVQTELQVRFLERNFNKDFASEKCVVKYTSIEAGKEPQTFLSIANIFSRLENGKWKKMVQYASLEAATALVFEKAEPLEK